MYNWLMALAAIALLSLLPQAVGLPGSLTIETGQARARAEGMRAEEGALLAYARVNAGAAGVIPPADLTMPVPFNIPYGTVAAIGTAAGNRMAVVYCNDPRLLPGAAADALVGLSDNAADAGVVVGGRVSSPQGALAEVPAIVPNGVAAIAEVVTP